jgi:uncharacterized membrane protein
MYARALFLFLHLLGIVLWLGLVFCLSLVTANAARREDPNVIAFAYRAAHRLLRSLGTAGVLLTLAGGVGLTVVMDYAFFRPFPNHWLFQMQVLGFIAAAVALFYQLPVAGRLARVAEEWARAGVKPDGFAALKRQSAIAGSVIGIVLIVLIGLGAFRVP